MTSLAIVNAGQIATMAGPSPRTGGLMRDVGGVANGTLIAEDGIVTRLGSAEELSADARKCDTVVDAKGRLVTPGLVDAHTHLAFAGSRERELLWKLEGLSYAEIARRGGGILDTVRATRAASREELAVLARERANIMLAHGTTTAEAKSGYGLSLDSEIKCLEALSDLKSSSPLDIVPTLLMAHALPPEFLNDRRGFLAEAESAAKIAKSRNLASFADVFMDDGYFTPDEAERVLRQAREIGLGAKLHCDELADLGGAALAAKCQCRSAEHLLLSNDAGLSTMAAKGVCAVLLPATPYALRMRKYAPARKMLDLGVPVALGTDFNPNCWTLSMQTVMELSVYNMGMTPAEALAASTVNAAWSMGAQERAGTISVGKPADLVVWEGRTVEDLAYRFGHNKALVVVKRGQVVWDAENGLGA